jgi:hypothetical protein
MTIKSLVKRAGSGVFRVVGSLTAGSRPLPDFLLIGTKRGGTTSLYYDILTLPQVIQGQRDEGCSFLRHPLSPGGALVPLLLSVGCSPAPC